MAAPVFGAISAVGNSTSGNFTFSQPTGSAAGHLLVAFVACKGDTFTFPTGWTTLLSVAGTGSNGGLRVAYIVRGASAPALTVSGRASADICLFQVARFSGFDPANPMSLLQNASNTSPVNTSGTVSLSPDDMVVLAFGSGSNATFSTYTDSSGKITAWTERGDNGTTNGSNTQLAIATGVVPTGTIDPYGPFQATGGSGTSTIGVFVINAAPTGVNLAAAVTAVSTITGAVSVDKSLAASVAAASTATADLTVTSGSAVMLDAVVTAVSTATGAVTVTKPLAASVTAVSTATSAVTVTKPLAASVAAVSTATSALAVTKPLAASVTAVSTATTALAVSKPLAASVTAASTATGNLSTAGSASLAAAVTAVATATGAMAVAKPLAASVAAVSTATAALAHGVPLAAAAQSVATATASLSASGASSLAASVTAVSTATGALAVAKPLAASVTAVSSATANLVYLRQLAASVTAVSTATGGLAVAKRLASSVTSISTATGALSTNTPVTLAASVGSVATASGSLRSIFTVLAVENAAANDSSVSELTPTAPAISLEALLQRTMSALVEPQSVEPEDLYVAQVAASLYVGSILTDIEPATVSAEVTVVYPSPFPRPQYVSAA